MAVEYKLRGDARQLKKELQSVTAKETRLEQQTIRTKQGFDRLNTSALKNENALRKAKLQTQKIAAAEQKFAISAKVATTSINRQRQAQNRMRRSTLGLAASIGALRNQVLLVTFALSGVVLAMKKAIDAGSDLNEAQNLVRKTFGDSASEVELFATKAAGAIGQTRGESLKLLGDLGSVVKGFGLTSAAAANFSQTALQLASDIGSLKNATTDEVLNAFRSAIIGQSEPMLRFGSDTRVATLEQIALEEGIINTKRALTNQEKSVAALVQVFRTNKDAIDDFKETQNEFATASKITAAKVREVVEILGTKMLPAAAQAAVGLTILIDNFDLVKKAAAEATKEFLLMQTGPVRFGLISPEQARSAANKVKEIFGDLVGFFKRVSGFDQANAPGNMFDQLFGSDREVIKQREARVGSSLDQLLEKFKDAQTKFESAFDIGAGVQAAIDSLGDGMRDVGDGLEESVLPAMEKITGFTTQMQVDAFKFALAMETARKTKLPSSLSESAKFALKMESALIGSANAMGRAVREGENFIQVLIKAAIRAAAIQVGGPGGFVLGLASGLFGFQHGGQFQVGGQGGPDSQTVAFRASPGETVTVTPPGQTNNSYRFNNNFTLVFPAVREIDDFELQTNIIPKINNLVQRGESRLSATDLA